MLCTSLLGVIGSYKLGANYLKTYIVLCYITANIIVPKIGVFFGLEMAPGVFLFSAIFLGTDMLAERYGKKVALEAVYLSFFAMIGFIILTQLSLLFTPVDFARPSAQALDLIFNGSPRIFLASLCAYIIWQYIDVLIYERLHTKTGEGFLWLRNNVSTLISSLGSTSCFFFLAFAGTGAHWMELALSGVSVYWVVALLDTALIYLSKRIKPLDC